MEGILVCLEGVDGSGKSTQIPLISKRLNEEGIKTSVYSYPTHDQFYGKIIREQFLAGKIELTPLDEVCLFLLDMAADKTRLEHDLAEGKVVFLDRYCFSTIAYQSSRGFDHEKIKMIARDVMELPRPTLVFYFDISPKEASKRKKKQKQLSADRNERDIAFQEKIKVFYDKLYNESYGADKWVKINARRKPQEITEEILKGISAVMEILVNE